MAKVKVFYKIYDKKIIEVPEKILDDENELFEFAQKEIGWDKDISIIYNENGERLVENC